MDNEGGFCKSGAPKLRFSEGFSEWKRRKPRLEALNHLVPASSYGGARATPPFDINIIAKLHVLLEI